ncbi:MAG TPA: DMT family transporter [Clostridiaceae bacterium]|jgi:drug/metabolite transporter (DMT)-like permease|nr:DMT family transporter [Clostridiaceae bacterium]
MRKRQDHLFAYISATLYAAIVSMSFLTVKIGLVSANPFELLAYRFTIAFLAIVLALAFRVVKLRITKEKILKLAPLALFYPVFYFSFQSFGLTYTTSVEAGIMNALIPVLTLILATIFLKEKTTVLQKLSIILSVLGVVYITLMKGNSSSSRNLVGIILLFVSSTSFSAYSVLVKKRSKEFSTTDISFVVTILGFASFNLLNFCNHLLKGTLSSYFEPLKNTSFIWSILYLGILSTLFTSLLANYSLSKIEASKMNVFVNLATVLSIAAGSVFLDEKIYYYHIIGSVLIVLGVLGTNFLGKR